MNNTIHQITRISLSFYLPDNPFPQQLRDRIWYSSQHHTAFHFEVSISWRLAPLSYCSCRPYWSCLQLLSFFQQNKPKTNLIFASPELPSMCGYFSIHELEAQGLVPHCRRPPCWYFRWRRLLLRVTCMFAFWILDLKLPSLSISHY